MKRNLVIIIAEIGENVKRQPQKRDLWLISAE